MFSRSTISEAIHAHNLREHALIDMFIMKYELEDAETSGGVTPKTARIIRHLINNPEAKGPSGGNLMTEIIEDLLQERMERVRRISYIREDPDEAFPNLVRSLKADGYIVHEGKLCTLLPESFSVASSESALEILLDKHGFVTAKGHLTQARSAHTRGEWASANGQIRTFIESMFDEIAVKLGCNSVSPGANTRTKWEPLATMNPSFFLDSLNEWQVGNNGGFVQGFFKRLHPDGSHPGLSDEEDSTFRLHMAMLVGNHYMRRFDTMT